MASGESHSIYYCTRDSIVAPATVMRGDIYPRINPAPISLKGHAMSSWQHPYYLAWITAIQRCTNRVNI